MNHRAVPAPTLRAVTCLGGARVEIERRPARRPSPGELLLDLRCCGLCGTDLFKIARSRHVGHVLGHELVGTVREIGQGVEGFVVGDRVVSPHHVACGSCRLCRSGASTRCSIFQHDQLEPGGFSDQIIVRERAVRAAARRIPDSMSDEAAVFLEPAACVLRGIDRSGLQSLLSSDLNPSAVILGGGPMGLLHVLVLKALCREVSIILSEPVESRRLGAARCGATATVSPADLVATQADLTHGRGVDAVFDTVGDPGLIEPSLALLREGGTLVLFAHCRQGQLAGVQEALFHHERRIVGTYSGSLAEQRLAFDLLDQHTLEPQSLVTHRIPLASFAEALELSRDPSALKILVVP